MSSILRILICVGALGKTCHTSIVAKNMIPALLCHGTRFDINDTRVMLCERRLHTRQDVEQYLAMPLHDRCQTL